jgi:hypothetical protein
MKSLNLNDREVAMNFYELDTQGNEEHWIDLDSVTQVFLTPKKNPDDPPPKLKLSLGKTEIDVASTKNITEILFILGIQPGRIPR